MNAVLRSGQAPKRMNGTGTVAGLVIGLLIASMVWAELRLVGRLWANDAMEYELLVTALSSDIVFKAAISAFLPSALFVVPTYLLLKGVIDNLAAAGAFAWLGIGLSAGNLLVFEFTHIVLRPGLWLLVDPASGAVAGFVAWSLFYRFGVWGDA